MTTKESTKKELNDYGAIVARTVIDNIKGDSNLTEPEFVNQMMTELNLITEKIQAKLDEVERETLDDIAEHEGWEDSRDLHAARLGIKYKYTDRFHKKG